MTSRRTVQPSPVELEDAGASGTCGRTAEDRVGRATRSICAVLVVLGAAGCGAAPSTPPVAAEARRASSASDALARTLTLAPDARPFVVQDWDDAYFVAFFDDVGLREVYFSASDGGLIRDVRPEYEPRVMATLARLRDRMIVETVTLASGLAFAAATHPGGYQTVMFEMHGELLVLEIGIAADPDAYVYDAVRQVLLGRERVGG